MNRLSLFKLISLIHAVKCNKSVAEEQANASFNKLVELKDSVANASEDQIATIRQQAMTWAAENPTATDQDINELLNQN